MKLLKSILTAVFISVMAAPVLAQSTASEGQPGYLAPQSTCPGGGIGPCFKPYGSIAPAVAGSAASGVVVRASPGNLLGVYVTAGATAGYLMVFNSTTVPADGATTAGTASGNLQECIQVPANTTQAISFQGGPTEYFTVGISAAFSSTGCATKTASATAFLHGIAQ